MKVDILWVLALLVSLVFAYFTAQGFWMGSIGVVGLVAALLIGLTQPFLLMVTWMVGMPTIFVVGNNVLEAAQIPVLTVDRAVFMLLLAFLIARALAHERTIVGYGDVGKAGGLFVAIVVLSWLGHSYDKTSTEIQADFGFLIDSIIVPYAALLIARNMEWNRRRVMIMIWSLVLGVGAYLIFAGATQYGLDWTVLKSQKNLDSIVHPDRMTGPFVNSLDFGMALTILTILALFLLLNTRSGAARFLLVCLCLGFLVCIVLSKGRGVWLGVPVVMLFLFFRVKELRAPLTAGAVFVGVVAPLVLPFVVDFTVLMERFNDLEPIYNRIALWATSLKMIAHQPLLGYGFGVDVFVDNKAGFYDSWGGIPAGWAAGVSAPHNTFLYITIFAGIFGLIAFVRYLYKAWIELDRAREDMKESAPLFSSLASFSQAIFVFILFNGWFLDLFYTYYVVIVTFFLIGLISRIHELVLRGDASILQPPSDVESAHGLSGNRSTSPALTPIVQRRNRGGRAV